MKFSHVTACNKPCKLWMIIQNEGCVPATVSNQHWVVSKRDTAFIQLL